MLAGSFQGFSVATERPEDLEKLGRALVACGLSARTQSDRLFVDKNGSDPRSLAATVNRLAFDEGLVLVELTPERTTLEQKYLEMVNAGGIR